jgi:siroheme synthase (precorrin-2 oxidase/ferrochelatase)
MDPLSVIAFAINFATKAPALIQAGADVYALFNQHKAQLEQFQAEGRNPTQAEWDAENARLDALEKELQSK